MTTNPLTPPQKRPGAAESAPLASSATIALLQTLCALLGQIFLLKLSFNNQNAKAKATESAFAFFDALRALFPQTEIETQATPPQPQPDPPQPQPEPQTPPRAKTATAKPAKRRRPAARTPRPEARRSAARRATAGRTRLRPVARDKKSSTVKERSFLKKRAKKSLPLFDTS